MTLVSCDLIAVLSRPRVTTTAIVITPSTTAYSAMVWPDSSRRSVWRSRMKSITKMILLRKRGDGRMERTDGRFASHNSRARPISQGRPGKITLSVRAARFGMVRGRDGDHHRRQAGGG